MLLIFQLEAIDELNVYKSSYEDEKKVKIDADLDASDRFFGGDLMEQHSSKKNDYTILSETNIRRRMEDTISKVSSVLSVSKVESSILLREFKWNVEDLTAAWFPERGEAEVRKRVGLFKNLVPVLLLDEIMVKGCAICSGSWSPGGLKGGNCVHPFCGGCFVDLIRNQINEFPGSSTIRCPEPSCGAAFNEDVIDGILTEEKRANYSKYLPNSRECVASIFDVSCLNSHSFCWNCLGEIHRPVDCNTVKEWADWLSIISNPEIETENKLSGV